MEILTNSPNTVNWSTPRVGGKGFGGEISSTLEANTLDLWEVGDRENGISSFYLMRTSWPWVGMSASTFPQTFSTNCHSPSLSPMA